jgi:phosphoribosylglycinamide formyltransferase-1
MKILVLVSGNGSNLQALIDAERRNLLGNHRITAVISDRADAFALKRAALAGVPSFVETPNLSLPKAERRLDLSNRILNHAGNMYIDLIVCAGFLSILNGGLMDVFSGRIINIHPSLLPKFGGKGMFGIKVHSAALAAHETESGCTVHFVDAEVDSGPVILQRRTPILPDDNPETLAKRILKEEHIAIVEAVVKIGNA